MENLIYFPSEEIHSQKQWFLTFPPFIRRQNSSGGFRWPAPYCVTHYKQYSSPGLLACNAV